MKALLASALTTLVLVSVGCESKPAHVTAHQGTFWRRVEPRGFSWKAEWWQLVISGGGRIELTDYVQRVCFEDFNAPVGWDVRKLRPFDRVGNDVNFVSGGLDSGFWIQLPPAGNWKAGQGPISTAHRRC